VGVVELGHPSEHGEALMKGDWNLGTLEMMVGRGAPILPISAAPTPVTIKEEPMQPQLLPLGCSAENPMEIVNRSDDDEVVIASHSLGAEGILPSGQIESFLRVIYKIAHQLPSG
jgi:hypothetical protein